VLFQLPSSGAEECSESKLPFLFFSVPSSKRLSARPIRLVKAGGTWLTKSKKHSSMHNTSSPDSLSSDDSPDSSSSSTSLVCMSNCSALDPSPASATSRAGSFRAKVGQLDAPSIGSLHSSESISELEQPEEVNSAVVFTSGLPRGMLGSDSVVSTPSSASSALVTLGTGTASVQSVLASTP